MRQEFFVKRKFKPLRYSQRKDGSFTTCQACKGEGCKICQRTGHNPKCDVEFLYSIKDKDSLAALLIDNSAAKHVLTAFLDPYLECKVWDPVHEAWVEHPNYRQAGPITGRMSCGKPNLMQVASDTSGRKRTELPIRVRECFVPRPGYHFWLPDYSQEEVWVFAFRAKDEKMIDLLLSGEDFHSGVAQIAWGDEPDFIENKSYYRKRAKLLLFSLIYGGGVKKQAELLECPINDAAMFRAQFMDRLPGVRVHMDNVIRDTRSKGYLVNAFGRVYPIERDKAYKAVNYDVQGSSADMGRRAMINIERVCDRYGDKLNLLLFLHDEYMLEAHQSLGPDVQREVISAMQQDHSFFDCPVPFPVGMKVATDCWANAKEVEL
jgi:DNA polymerase-1